MLADSDDFMILEPTTSAVWAAVLVAIPLAALAHAVFMYRRHGDAAPEPAATSYRGWAIVFTLMLAGVVFGALGKYFLLVLVGDRIDTAVTDTSYSRTNNKGQIIETYRIEAVALDDTQVYDGEVGEALHDRVFAALHSYYRKDDRVEVQRGDTWSPATIAEHYAKHPRDGVDLQSVRFDDPTQAPTWVDEREIRLPADARAEALRVPFMVVPSMKSIHQVGTWPGLDTIVGRIGVPLLVFFIVGIGYAVGRPDF